MYVLLKGVNGSWEVSSSADDDDLMLLSDVDASLQSLSLKHHLAVKSVRVFLRSESFDFLWLLASHTLTLLELC